MSTAVALLPPVHSNTRVFGLRCLHWEPEPPPSDFHIPHATAVPTTFTLFRLPLFPTHTPRASPSPHPPRFMVLAYKMVRGGSYNTLVRATQNPAAVKKGLSDIGQESSFPISPIPSLYPLPPTCPLPVRTSLSARRAPTFACPLRSGEPR